MKTASALAGIIKKMISSNNGIYGLQICIATAVAMTLPSLSAHTPLSPSTAVKQEMLSVCRAPQRALLPFETFKDNMRVIDKGDTAWKPFNGVDAGVDMTSYVEGRSSTKLDIKDGFSEGPIAGINTINNTEGINSSDIACLTFWAKSSKQVGGDVLQLRLIDSTGGTTSLNIDIPENVLDGRDWKKASVVISGTSTIGNNIDTLVLYASRDPGNVTIWLDIIEARISSEMPGTTKSRLNELVLDHDEGILTAG
jgi:hypothetical protein